MKMKRVESSGTHPDHAVRPFSVTFLKFLDLFKVVYDHHRVAEVVDLNLDEGRDDGAIRLNGSAVSITLQTERNGFFRFSIRRRTHSAKTP